jgi:hypothetical protein
VKFSNFVQSNYKNKTQKQKNKNKKKIWTKKKRKEKKVPIQNVSAQTNNEWWVFVRGLVSDKCMENSMKTIISRRQECYCEYTTLCDVLAKKFKAIICSIT